MTRAYVVMTAMPPTRGHLHLIQFASELGDSTEVILCTQPEEPWTQQRYDALSAATRHIPGVHIHRLHRELPQEPTLADEAPFWDMWAGFLRDAGIAEGDYVVASEQYGAKLAERVGAIFMPYDIYREVDFTKATEVREAPMEEFAQILPEFQPYLRKTITIFGAESTGKTTLARATALDTNGYFLPEWARPYLETVSIDITDASMTAIWRGQRALQRQAQMLNDRPFIIQDTDLFSTVGYWDYMMESETPQGLIDDAIALKSDLYIVTLSNIPFEEDPIRYGGDHRETSDQHWIDILDKYNLPYVILRESEMVPRADTTYDIVTGLFSSEAGLDYTRRGREYDKTT